MNPLRRLFTVAALGAVLTLLILLNQQSASWRYVATGRPGDVLYAATFDAFNEDWSQYDDGQLMSQVVDSRLRLTNGQTDRYAFSVAGPTLADFDLRVDASATSGPLNNGYGVLFRYVDRENFYVFMVSSDGYYGVFGLFNGQQRPLSNWIDSDVAAQGLEVVNRLRVIGTENTFQFFVNDQPVPLCIPVDPEGISTYQGGQCFGGTMESVLIDERLPTGQIGVVARTLDEPNVQAEFDSLVIYVPEPLS